MREIDQLNIYHATHLAMRRAIARVGGHEHVLVDGNRIVGFEAQVGPYSNVVDGDAKVYSIACASVVAKVVRDRMMIKLAARYPGYGWEHNQGYATRDHRDAIRRWGSRPFHRRSFLALQRTLAGDQLDFDLLADPAASPLTHDLLERELVPVMADDAALDAVDLVALEASPERIIQAGCVAVHAGSCGMSARRDDARSWQGRPASTTTRTAAQQAGDAAERWSRTACRQPAGPSWPGTSMSAVTRSTSWRSTRVRRPRSWWSRCAGVRPRGFGLPRRPSITASARPASDRRSTGSWTAAPLPDGTALPRLPPGSTSSSSSRGGRGGEPSVRHHRAAF